jgi:predicted RNase H-like HicB family nuclease
MTQKVHVKVRFEDQAFWATVDEYPGVFATGDSIDELRESLEEGLSLVVAQTGPQEQRVRLSPLAAEPFDTIATAKLTIA